MASRFDTPLLCALFIAGVICPDATAQRGDRPGEVQSPPSAKWSIPPAPALSPEEALKTLKLAPGFRAELVAAEPLIHDPVIIRFGPDGRLWVVEMRGYMPNVDGTGEDSPVGSIVVLEDTDGDGRMDKRTVFLDRLIVPRAIALIDDGVLVGEPPNLWFCRDTNGDGVSDEKTRVTDNYGPIGNPELAANGLFWAMDNWIYNSNSTLRLRYEGGGKFRVAETVLRGQWGIAQDDVGRLYTTHNTSPLHCDLVPPEYFRRNRFLTATGADVVLAPTNLRLFPVRVNPGVNRGYRTLRDDGTLPAVTAACGTGIYRGDLFPAEFAGNAFVCEPAANLVKRLVLEERDGTMTARNADEKSEFLASTDERFRPVHAANGPDGALYVVDMYRGLIQHRIYVTSYLRKQVEARGLDQPTGMGRIYRIVPKDAGPAKTKPNLAGANAAELVRALAHRNGWWRDTAQQLLVERRGSDAVEPLRKLVLDTNSNPLGRLHALWTLEGIEALDRPTVLRALGDRDPRVGAAAIRLAERWLAPSAADDAIRARVIALAQSAPGAPIAPAVRLQLALSLGEGQTPEADAALRTLVANAGEQAYVADAAVSGIAGRETEFVAALTRSPGSVARAIALATAAVFKSGNATRIEQLLAIAADEKAPVAARRAVLAGIDQFIPRTSDGRMRAAKLPAEPKALIALAKIEQPLARDVVPLLAGLTWPGKPGDATPPATEALTADQSAFFEKGRQQYMVLCVACHQTEGQGTPGVALPLVGSRWALGDDRALARIVLNGKASGNLAMPSLRAVLDDQAIAAVLTYVRGSWGNRERAISPDVVAEARAATAKRDEPWTDAELEELLQQMPSRRRSF